MKDKHRYQLLFAMLLAAFMANAGPVERINVIKRDPLYVYGEATKPTMADAYDAALNILQSNIQQWYETQDKDKSGRVVRNLTFLADTIHAMRGSYHRVFAYVSIAKVEETIKSDAEKEAKARAGGRSATVDSSATLHTDAPTNEMLRTLVNSQNYREFVAVITRNRQNGLVISASRDITQQPSGSYLAIFNKTKRDYTLLYLLKPGDGHRDDLITGQKIDSDILFQNRDNYRFLWFVPSKSN